MNKRQRYERRREKPSGPVTCWHQTPFQCQPEMLQTPAQAAHSSPQPQDSQGRNDLSLTRISILSPHVFIYQINERLNERVNGGFPIKEDKSPKAK